MTNYVLKNASIVNEGKITVSDIRISEGRITKIASDITPGAGDVIMDLSGKHFFLPASLVVSPSSIWYGIFW
jgi:dihydroorotase